MPDVNGLLTQVPVVDNQWVKQDQVLIVVDRPRYEQALLDLEHHGAHTGR